MKYDYTVHPVADMFPMIEPYSREWNALKFSFNDHGQLDPIVIHEGVLLDGRNRLAMCKMLGLDPKVIEFRQVVGGDIGDEEHTLVISEWILAKNLARRNLSQDQQAAVVVEVNRWAIANEARQEAERSRFQEGNKGGQGGDRKSEKAKSTVKANSPSPLISTRDTKEMHANSTRAKLAKASGVSESKIRQATVIADAESAGTLPEGTLGAVKAGTIKASAAEKMIPKKTKPTPTFEEAFAKRWKTFTKGIAASDAPKFRQLISNQLKNPTL